MSRMIPTAMMIGGLIVAGGCGGRGSHAESAPDPMPPSGPSPAEQRQPPPSPPTGAAQIVSEMNPDQHRIPNEPVRGQIAGQEVRPQVELEGDELRFEVFHPSTPGVAQRAIRIRLAPMRLPHEPPPTLTPRSWKIRPDTQRSANVPHVFREVAGQDTHFYPEGYALTLELGPRVDGQVAGKIYLCLMDTEQTVLAGTFTATYVRSPTEKPGPEEAPFIGGDIVVAGAKPASEVRVSYVAITAEGIFFKELQDLYDTPGSLRLTRDDNDKPRASAVVSGDGPHRPFRYEHVKLLPGRYLIAASVVGGPVVSKWVDVHSGSTITENFTLDPTQQGGVEVTVPATTTGKLLIVPADEAAKAPLDDNQLLGIMMHLYKIQPEVVGGKALVKNLAPGKYEVRVGELRGRVEITAGKTAEVTLTAAKP
ncbi:MAG: hypothetical protein RMJ56_05825 [Gemmataceae bacterium]|nr:hypothetical protein [Gemmata sp.]MDW8197107.1 hypothetical protein [Gemmataceae bacterium]